MSFTRWLSNGLGLIRRPAFPRKKLSAQHRFRPNLESLEDRWMPSTLTVTSIADSGVGSLRAEIAAAHNGDTIVFDKSVFSTAKTITLTTGELFIKHNVTITGPGAGILAISGGNTSRVLEVGQTASKVAFSGLTIRDANSVQNPDHTAAGGAVENHGGLTISNSTLTYNTGGIGGAIDSDGTLTVSSCILSNNTAGDGGAIYSHHTGTLTVSNSNLFYNSAPKDLGGGINTDGPTTISGCTLTHNSAVSGGGIISSGPISITNCTLSNNTASDTGGGIYCTTNAYYTSFTATVSGTSLSNNSAVNGGAIFTGSPGMTLKLEGNCILTGNSATYGGGVYIYSGALSVSNSTLSSNTASSAGGGIYILARNQPVVTLTNDTFIGNINTTTNTADQIFGSWIDGGGNTFS
jgi:parallel beta-helix repeat protein/predicted outer membrane repeat protein